MPGKLVFHIGDRKTGTSSIQRALALGKIHLENRKLLYPCKVSHNYLLRHVVNYAEKATFLPGNSSAPGLRKIADLMPGADYTIVSGEEFESAKPGDVGRVMKDVLLPQVKDHMVLCYVRPHAARILSSFVEQTKIGLFAGDLAKFHLANRKTGRMFYTNRMAAWAEEFPGHFVMRPMVRDRLYKQSAVWDFVQTAFGEDAALAVVAEHDAVNESLCIEDLMLLKEVQSHVRYRGKTMGMMMGWELARLVNATPARSSRTRPKLDRKLAKEIRRTYLEDARNMDRNFPNDPVFVSELDRSVDEAALEPQSFRVEDYYNSETLGHIRVLARLIDEMLNNNQGNWPNFLRRCRQDALFPGLPDDAVLTEALPVSKP